MSWWHSITHVGSFVKSEVNKGKTIYTAQVHDMAGAVSDATQGLTDELTGSQGSFPDDIGEIATQFILTKSNGVVKHYMDSDGDGLFNKKSDQFIAKTKAPAGSFFSDLADETHSILGDHGTMVIHGLQHTAENAYSEYKDFLGVASTASSDASLGFWETITHGISVMGQTNRLRSTNASGYGFTYTTEY